MIEIALPRNGRANALANGLDYFIVEVAVVLPRLDPVPRRNMCRRFDRVAVEFDVPGTNRLRSFGPSFIHPHRPHPHVDADGFCAWLGH